MAFVAGDFSESELVETILKADAMWSDAMLNADYIAETGVLDAIRAEQTANLKLLEDPEKDRDVRVTWLGTCNNTVRTITNNECTIGGAEISSDSKTYSMATRKAYDFTVDETVWRTNNHSMSEAVAVSFLLADKALTDEVSQAMVAFIETSKGENQVNDGIGTVNVVSGDTDIAAANWNERMFAYLYRIAKQNKFTNPFLLSGTNLFEDQFIAEAMVGNSDGKGALALFRSMRKYFDLFNIDTVNSPDLKTYMINRGTLAFASKNYYNPEPVVYKSQDRYSIQSRNMPGVTYDVYYTNRCVGNTMKHDFSVHLKYGLYLNPVGCTADRTGIIAFNKV